MKKVSGILGFAAVLMFVATAAHAVPATGTQAIGANATVSLKPGAAKNIFLNGFYGKFISDGIFVGGGLTVAKWDGVDDPSVSVQAVAQYWMGLSDGLDFFAGLNINAAVMPSPVVVTAGVDLGVAHWLADNTAITAVIDTDLGDVSAISGDSITMQLAIGVAQFF